MIKKGIIEKAITPCGVKQAEEDIKIIDKLAKGFKPNGNSKHSR